MADLGLIKRMVEDGYDRDAASDQVDAVMDAIRSQLIAGKSVTIDGVGQLRAPRKIARVGYPPKHLREQRKVALRNAAVIEHGDAYPDPVARDAKRSTYGR